MTCCYSYTLILHYPRPRNKEELYNLRHASARNVIECIFGIIKKCFKILREPPSYDLSVQVQILPALCAIHNFIRRHDPEEVDGLLTHLVVEEPEGHLWGDLAPGVVNRANRQRADAKRDQIAERMWEDYVSELAARGLAVEGH